jgi:hypothetical protein
LWARQEPTKLEHLSDDSFLGKPLVLPANIRLGWKVIEGTNALAYLASMSAMKEKHLTTLISGQGFSLHRRYLLRLPWHKGPIL